MFRKLKFQRQQSCLKKRMNSKKSLLSEKLITFHPPHLKKLTLSWRRPLSYRNPSIDLLCKSMGWLSYRNQSIDLLCKSMDWFLYDIGPRHERVKQTVPKIITLTHIWGKIFKNGPSEICERQPFFKGCLPQVSLGSFVNTLSQIFFLNCFYWFVGKFPQSKFLQSSVLS